MEEIKRLVNAFERIAAALEHQAYDLKPIAETVEPVPQQTTLFKMQEQTNKPQRVKNHFERWTKEEDERLLKMYNARISFKRMAQTLGRTKNSCQTRMQYLKGNKKR